MLLGIKFQALPTPEQAKTLCSWMGASKTIWNAKCDEDKYLRTYAKKYLSIGTFPKLDQQYSQYKNADLTPWLFDCPSQILRNTATKWYDTYQRFFKITGSGRPKRKNRTSQLSIHLTRELFAFKKTMSGYELFIGTKTNNIGNLKLKWHTKDCFENGYPNSIVIKKLPSGRFTVSFCFGEAEKKHAEIYEQRSWLEYLKTRNIEELSAIITPIDRGINVPVATDKELLNFKIESKLSMNRWSRKLKKLQARMARKKRVVEGRISKRREKIRLKIARSHEKISNIRSNETHHISKKLVSNIDSKVFILEDLRTKNMTRSAAGNAEIHGKNVKQKSGLNREILNIGWNQIERRLIYKARKNKKVVFKINPALSSQECADCGHTHPGNRDGIYFRCMGCGQEDHADINAGKILKKGAIKLFLDSGTELSDKGVLRLKDKGRGAEIRPLQGKPKEAQASKRQKRKEILASA